MLGDEAPGWEMHPGPEWEYAGPVWVRDDCGGGWEAIAKNMSPGILYEVYFGEQNIGLMVSNDFAFPTPMEVVHYIPSDLAWTGTLYIQEVGYESQPTIVTASSPPAVPLFGPLSGWQKLFALKQIGQPVEQSGPMPAFLVHFLPRGPPRPGSVGDFRGGEFNRWKFGNRRRPDFKKKFFEYLRNRFTFELFKTSHQ